LHADKTSDTLAIPGGVLILSPGNMPATSYSTSTNSWTTFQAGFAHPLAYRDVAL
jgi:hydrogenase/urease accessory protein HupE